MSLDSDMQAAHQLTNLMLRGFTRGGKIVVEDKVSGVVTTERTDNVGKVDHPADHIEESEAKWQKVETAFGPAIKSIRLYKLSDYPEQIAATRDFLALHYTRSILAYKLRDEAVKNGTAQKILDKVHQEVSQKVGRPLTPTEISKTTAHWFTTAMDTLPIGIQSQLFDKVQPFVANKGLVVYEAPAGSEFVLGDNPVITLTKDGKIGALQGARIDESINVGMPISPRFAIGLKGEGDVVEYQTLTPDQVERINASERAIAQRFVYYRPKPGQVYT